MTLKMLRARIIAEMAENNDLMNVRASYGGPDPDPSGSAKLVGKSETLRLILAWIDET